MSKKREESEGRHLHSASNVTGRIVFLGLASLLVFSSNDRLLSLAVTITMAAEKFM